VKIKDGWTVVAKNMFTAALADDTSAKQSKELNHGLLCNVHAV